MLAPGAEVSRDRSAQSMICAMVDVSRLRPGVVTPNATIDLADVAGPGRITHIWMTTHPDHWRSLLLRAFWDGAAEPAVVVPVGDLFGQGWGRFAQLSSSMVAANPHGGLNSYWPMPFRRSARLTLENLAGAPAVVYFQITYESGGDESGSGYLHAQWRRSNPVPALHTVVDGVAGLGQYVGTYLAWGVNSRGWWGEGEVKFYLDGDDEYPTICGTGTEDYFGGAWNFDVPGQGYTAYTTPYLGLHQIITPDGLYESQQRFGMYRWHVADPVRFDTALRVDVQALGWRAGHRYVRRCATDPHSRPSEAPVGENSTARGNLRRGRARRPGGAATSRPARPAQP
jgi:hypothetical protein